MTIAELLDDVICGQDVKLYNIKTEEETDPTDELEQLAEEYGDVEVASIEAEGDTLVINY